MNDTVTCPTSVMRTSTLSSLMTTGTVSGVRVCTAAPWGRTQVVRTAGCRVGVPETFLIMNASRVIGPSEGPDDTGVKIYVRVPDLQAALDRAEELGGKALV